MGARRTCFGGSACLRVGPAQATGRTMSTLLAHTMRLGRSRRSGNVLDARGGGGRKIGLGIGGLVIILLGALFGVDLSGIVGAVGQGGGGQVSVEAGAPTDEGGDFVAAVLGETEDVWSDLFQRSGYDYPEPELVLFSGVVPTACGTGQSATGPFYCPRDRRVYFDLSFYGQLQRLGAGGDFALAYVIAHEVGHHIQNVEGTLEQVQRAQAQLTRRGDQAQANALSVRAELQADCYAGVWAYHSERERDVLEAGDVEEGLRAAAAVGDDNIQSMAGRAASPETFTHGTSQQRVSAFREGFATGDPQACDTFGDLR